MKTLRFLHPNIPISRLIFLISLAPLATSCTLKLRTMELKTTTAPAPTPGPPYELVFSGATSTAANSCLTLTLTQKDSNHVAATSGSTTNITLAGVGSFAHFYTSALCTVTTTTASIPSGQTSTTVYFTGSYVQSGLTLTASGLTVDASQSMAVTGPFASPSPIATAASGLGAGYWIASTDFDNDGKLDIAVADRWGGKIYVAWGDGAGSFTPGPNINVGSEPLTLAVGSLRGNANKDIIVPRYTQAANTANISVILGNGNRTFQAPVTYNSTGTHTHATSVEVGTNLLNNTGKLDVIVAYEGGPGPGFVGAGVDVFPGNGDGTLGAATGFATNGVPNGIPAVGDLNSDGKTDFIIPLTQGGNANGTWYRNTGAGFATTALNPGGGFYANVYAFGNFNNDGWMDWALGLDFWGAFTDTNTNGTGGSSYVETVTGTNMNSCNYRRVRTGIFTGSLNTDVIFAQRNPGSPTQNGILFYPGKGDGTFKKEILYHFTDNVADFVSGDFDGDGKLDLVVLTDTGLLYFMKGQ